MNTGRGALVLVSFRLACGCTWRKGRGGPIPSVEAVRAGMERTCWRHGTVQTIVRCTTWVAS